MNSGELSRKLRKHVEDSERIPEAKMISLRAINAFDLLIGKVNLTPKLFDPILAAMKSRYSGPYFIGTELFLNLICKFPSLCEILDSMMSSKTAHERWVAISLVRDECVPDNIALALIKKGINDTSIKIRLFAVESIYTRNFSALVDELFIRRRQEKNSKVLEYIDWVITRMKH